jgi:hypothetical protein
LLGSFRKKKKTMFLVAIATAILLVFSSHTAISYSETANFTLPCTINTYGNAWNGELAFPLSGPDNSNYLVCISTKGSVLNLRESSGYSAVYNIADNTLLFQGEPYVDGAGSAPTYATHIWNMATNTTEDFPNVISHHDIQYDPVNNTFLTLQDYVKTVGNNAILYDKIVQVDAAGKVLWTWDTYDYIPLSEASPFNETTTIKGQTVEDFTHANSLDWDYNNNIIYLNLRNTNTFYKIDQTTGQIIWACGEFGNFTLLGANGQQVSSLWYHSHDVKEVAPDVFTMFNNDDANNTNPDDCHSSMLEVTLDETSMTAYVNWSWEAPTQYWTPYGGATVILPNGDVLSDFADPTHQYSQNQPWNFNNTGAVFVEVNSTGQVVRTFTFPVGWYVYRVEAVTATSPTPSSTALPILPVAITALAITIVVIVVLAIVISKRKTRATLKTNSNKQNSVVPKTR